jgi:hypothetical protein
MSERRVALVDFTYTGKTARVRAWPTMRQSRQLVAKQRLSHWRPPSIFRPPEVLTEAEVIEAEAELKALQRHALEVVDPETGV